MKSPTLDLQDDQKFALMKLKRNVRDVVKQDQDDFFYVRWLVARKWNCDAAEKMLRESMKWRESLQIDEIADWNPPQNLDSYYSYGFMGFTKTHHPVAVIALAGLDVTGFVKTLYKEELVKVAVKLIEHHLRISEDFSRAHSNSISARQFVVLVDLQNFAVRQYLTKQILDIAIMLAKIYEANYPGILKKVYIINAPAIFTVAFNVLKKFLSPETINCVKIMNSDRKKWEKSIMELIDVDLLPKFYGGTLVDENGDEKCSQMICYGGKIPKEYYRNNQSSEETMEADIDKIESEVKAVILDAGV